MPNNPLQETAATMYFSIIWRQQEVAKIVQCEEHYSSGPRRQMESVSDEDHTYSGRLLRINVIDEDDDWFSYNGEADYAR